MRKDLVMIIGIGLPVAIFMILIGGGGYSDFKFEKEYGKINMTPEITQRVIDQTGG